MCLNHNTVTKGINTAPAFAACADSPQLLFEKSLCCDAYGLCYLEPKIRTYCWDLCTSEACHHSVQEHPLWRKRGGNSSYRLLPNTRFKILDFLVFSLKRSSQLSYNKAWKFQGQHQTQEHISHTRKQLLVNNKSLYCCSCNLMFSSAKSYTAFNTVGDVA